MTTAKDGVKPLSAAAAVASLRNVATYLEARPGVIHLDCAHLAGMFTASADRIDAQQQRIAALESGIQGLRSQAAPIAIGRLEELRDEIERRYEHVQLGSGACGGVGAFGEILCHELHMGNDPQPAGLHFAALAEKWGVDLPTLGDLIADHCRRLVSDVEHLRSQAGSSFAWVIELPLGGAPSYWNGAQFSPDHRCAVRFSRQEDAQRVIDGGRATSAVGPTLSRMCKAVEHGWIGDPQAGPDSCADLVLRNESLVARNAALVEALKAGK